MSSVINFSSFPCFLLSPLSPSSASSSWLRVHEQQQKIETKMPPNDVFTSLQNVNSSHSHEVVLFIVKMALNYGTAIFGILLFIHVAARCASQYTRTHSTHAHTNSPLEYIQLYDCFIYTGLAVYEPMRVASNTSAIYVVHLALSFRWRYVVN